MATVTRTFDLSDRAATELDRWAREEQCDPADVVDSLLLLFGDSPVEEGDFTPEQWAMIREGEADADAGRFATQDEMDAIFRRFSISG